MNLSSNVIMSAIFEHKRLNFIIRSTNVSNTIYTKHSYSMLIKYEYNTHL